MELYSVTDGYINYLQQEHEHVYSNKDRTRINMRKYIGVVMTVDGHDYFIPLSSPKPRDYLTAEDGTQQIRKDNFTVFRIVDGDKLYGTIQFSNMIPVPKGELLEYDANAEPDQQYKDLVRKELEYIRKNEGKIISRARAIYYQKCSGLDSPVLRHCLDYPALEKMCAAWEEMFG